MSSFPASLSFWPISLHHIRFLHFVFNSICKAHSQLSPSCNSCTHSHAILIVPPVMSVFFFSSAAWSSIDVATFVSARRLHPPVFSCIERSHPSHACIFPLASFDTRTALYVAVLVHHLFSRSCDLTVSAINRGVLPHVIAHALR